LGTIDQGEYPQVAIFFAFVVVSPTTDAERPTATWLDAETAFTELTPGAAIEAAAPPVPTTCNWYTVFLAYVKLPLSDVVVSRGYRISNISNRGYRARTRLFDDFFIRSRSFSPKICVQKSFLLQRWSTSTIGYPFVITPRFASDGSVHRHVERMLWRRGDYGKFASARSETVPLSMRIESMAWMSSPGSILVFFNQFAMDLPDRIGGELANWECWQVPARWLWR
jgi:hypothetical protein